MKCTPNAQTVRVFPPARLHLRSIQSSCLRSSASAHAFFLPHPPPHSWCGELCTRRLEVGRAVDLRKARLQTPPGDVRWPRASRAMAKGGNMAGEPGHL